MKDLVSVIMPTYNSGATLQRSVDSILNQTYTNIELLITDDCSKDNTAELIRRIADSDSRVHATLLTSNFGPGYARNEAIGRAKGRYIAFCASLCFPQSCCGCAVLGCCFRHPQTAERPAFLPHRG